jgi:lipopolysaccharide transport system ATP-binding protein
MGAIKVTNLGKAYKQYPNRWARLLEWINPFNQVNHKLHWVLKDINFSVEPGEAVGIIGINGAGKSTLLKLITGTTQPSSGSVQMTGRVAALLELGMGFHPDFTGRQNVYMAGQLLGYSMEDIANLMPEIEAFAEIGDYIDQPVRVYSSGMQMRLAFSVATAKRPDILIVDEALSVGDAYFQHKSFERIRQFRKQGTTLLIVSHDKGAIQAVCDKAILLNKGKISREGTPEAVMDYYNAVLSDSQNLSIKEEVHNDGKIQTISGTGEAVINKVQILNDQGKMIEIVSVGQSISLEILIDIVEDIPELVVGFLIKDRIGQPIFGTNSHHLKQECKNLKSGSKFSFVYEFHANLGLGTYSISVALHSGDSHIFNNYEWRDLAMVFNIVNINLPIFAGCAWLPSKLEIKNA